MFLSSLLIYSLCCSVGLLLMYGAIRFSRVGMMRYGRVAILASVLSVAVIAALPLVFGWQLRPVILVEMPMALIPVTMPADALSADVMQYPERTVNGLILFRAIYLVGVIIAIVRMAVTTGRIVFVILRSQRRSGVLLSLNKNIVPFTWGGMIVMSRSDYEADNGMLLAHESAHKIAHHWIDLLVLNLLGCLTWYCPAACLIRRELQLNHEFTADRAVLAAGFDAKEYQMLLISKASGRRFANSVADCINNHSLKSRIIMMQKKIPIRHGLLRSMAFVPAGLIVLTLASSQEIASKIGSTMPSIRYVANETPAPVPTHVDDEKIEIEVSNTASVKVVERANVIDTAKVAVIDAPVADTKLKNVDDDKVRTENQTEGKEKTFGPVEKAPGFPGGEVSMYSYLSKNLRYPEECAKRGIQGRVVVQFVVKKDGSIGAVKIVRGADPQLDGEAVRLIRSFPKFEPGKMNGEPVNVWYTIPVMFKLSDDALDVKDNRAEEVK